MRPGAFWFNLTDTNFIAAGSLPRRLRGSQLELEGLMAKAGPDASGHFVSTIAYRPEYLQLRGQMNEIRKTSAEKKCKLNPDAGLGARVSDQIIR